MVMTHIAHVYIKICSILENNKNKSGLLNKIAPIICFRKSVSKTNGTQLIKYIPIKNKDDCSPGSIFK